MIKQFIKKILKQRQQNSFYRTIVLSNKSHVKASKKIRKFCFKHGFSIDDYFTYCLDKNNYRNYIPTIDSFLPRNINDSRLMIVSDNKILFEFLMKDYFNVSQNIAYIDNFGIIRLLHKTSESLIDILKKDEYICKPCSGYDGANIYKICFKNSTFLLNDNVVDENSLLEYLSSFHNFLIQKFIKQHQYAHDIYPESLNTIRIISAFTENKQEHEIICALHRFGSTLSKPADNFSKGGLSSLIDIDTGKLGKITGKTLFDNCGNRLFLSEHPDTGKKVEGVVVPFWNEIKNKIISFSHHIGFFKFIAWDITIGANNEIYVVETNMKSSLDLFQIHCGMKGSKLDLILQGYKNEKK